MNVDKSNSRTSGRDGTFPSYCRVCQASCGVLVDVEDGCITNVRGDPDNPLSRGYICSKGRESPMIHHGRNRLLHSQVRGANGAFLSIDADQAIHEIAARLKSILREDGPDSIALFSGTYALFGALTPALARGWLKAIGSHALYTTGTIDQSAKWIVPLRMGRWLGGWQNFDESDIWLLSGTNPLVSMQGGGTLTGFPAYDPVHRLREAKERGLKLIVIDPRRTETARYADLYLQPRPGHDAEIFAALINILLEKELYDQDFCNKYVGPLADLRRALSGLTPTLVAERAGIMEKELYDLAYMFAEARRGMAHGGTGPDMGPHSNLAEHLIATLNVLCGRYARAGDKVANPGVLKKQTVRRAQVAPPVRQWENSPKTQVGEYGTLWGEHPTTALPEQILQSGRGRIRALIVVGGNPMACWPDQARTRQALSALDLLVVVDPRMTQTAELADYVIAPTLPFERPDHTAWYEAILPAPYAQYTPAIITPPEHVIDDWRFFYRLSACMSVDVPFMDDRLATHQPEPESDELLRRMASNGNASYDAVVSERHGRIFSMEDVVLPDDGASTRFNLLPEDVRSEIDSLLANPYPPDQEPYPFRLICRRARWIMNSYDRAWLSAQRDLADPTAWVNPDDLCELGLRDGGWATIRSAKGQISAVLRADASIRPGVVSMPHCQDNAITNRLVDISHRETINAMPVMSSIPVCLYAGKGESRFDK